MQNFVTDAFQWNNLGAGVQAAMAPGDARGAVAGAIVAGVALLALRAGRAAQTP